MIKGSSINKSEEPAAQNSGAGLWLIQVILGLLLILLLGLHMVAHHFIVDGGLRTFQDVLDYVSNPLIFMLEVIFLLVVTPHAMLGLYGIVIDLGPSPGQRKVIVWLFRLATIITIGYGIWLAVAIQGL